MEGFMSASVFSQYSEKSLTTNPLDIAEQLIVARDWMFDRPEEDELVAQIKSDWCDYRIWFTWQSSMEVVIFSCAFDTRIPKRNREGIYKLLAGINERLWIGHFDISDEDGEITYRHALLLRGGKGASEEQMEDIMDIAINECNRFYPAFQAVIWGGNTYKEALELALMDTVGEA
jgi:hypothetical protein